MPRRASSPPGTARWLHPGAIRDAGSTAELRGCLPPKTAVVGLADYPDVQGGRLAVPVPPELLVVAPKLTQYFVRRG